MPICKFARAPQCGLFPELANYGYCASQKETYYGFKGLLVITAKGHLRSFYITAANIDEPEAVLNMDLPINAHMLGDKGFLGQEFTQTMAENGIDMHTPMRDNMQESRSPAFVKKIMNKRRYIETVIGKLIDQFSIVKHKARDIWRLTNKITRKLLSYTCALNFHGSTQFLKT